MKPHRYRCQASDCGLFPRPTPLDSSTSAPTTPHRTHPAQPRRLATSCDESKKIERYCSPYAPEIHAISAALRRDSAATVRLGLQFGPDGNTDEPTTTRLRAS